MTYSSPANLHYFFAASPRVENMSLFRMGQLRLRRIHRLIPQLLREAIDQLDRGSIAGYQEGPFMLRTECQP